MIAVGKIDLLKVNRYGIIGGRAIGSSLLDLYTSVEKPPLGHAPSNLAIAGRYVLTPKIFDQLRKTLRGKGNEIQLTNAIFGLLSKERVLSFTLKGKRYDISNKLEFIKTIID